MDDKDKKLIEITILMIRNKISEGIDRFYQVISDLQELKEKVDNMDKHEGN